MPPKRKSQRGGSATGDALLAAAKFIKDKKLISQGLRLLPGATAQSAGTIAEQLGFGKKKRARKTQRGGSGWFNDIPHESFVMPMRGGSWITDIGDSIGALARGVGNGLGGVLRGSGARRTVRAQL